MNSPLLDTSNQESATLSSQLKATQAELRRVREELEQARYDLDAARRERLRLSDLVESERAHYHSVFEGMGEGLLITDLNDRVLYANERITQMCGYSSEEMAGRPAYEVLLPRDEWPEINQRNERRAQGHSDVYEAQLMRKSGERFWALIHATPLRDADGQIVGTIGAQIDISERKTMEMALRLSETHLQAVVQHAVDGFIIHDFEGQIIEANERICAWLGYSREEILSLNVRDIETTFPDEKLSLIWNTLRRGGQNTVRGCNRRSDGSTFPVEVRVGSIEWNGELAVLALMHDITQSQQQEDARRELEGRFKSVVGAASDAIVLANEEGKIVLWNRGAEKIFGWCEEEALGRNVTSLMPERFYDLHQAGLERVSQSGELDGAGRVFSLMGLHRDGYEFPIEMTLGIWREGGRTSFSSVIRDVSERERLERSLRDALWERRLIMEAVPDVLFRLDLNGNLVAWNRELERVTGLTAASLSGRDAADFFEPVHHPIIEKALDRSIHGKQVEFEAPLLCPSGETIPFSFSTVPLHDESGTLLGLAGTGRDITERLKAEEQTRLALNEKEVLLKEIHHRVKNNLQIINSLLSMQADALDDKSVRAALAESQNRVRAMGLIHETLYLAGDMGRIDMHAYCARLTNALVRGYGETVPGVEIFLDVPSDLFLPLDSAVPCGLIINELITNSFKYAFPNKGKGHITVNVSVLNSRWTLRVSDNGIGLPEMNLNTVTSTGLQLVTALCDQLEATYKVNRAQGTEWTISFKSA